MFTPAYSLPPANEVWGKVMFLHQSVCLQGFSVLSRGVPSLADGSILSRGVSSLAGECHEGGFCVFQGGGSMKGGAMKGGDMNGLL